MSTVLLVLFGFALGMAIIYFPMMDRQKRIDERERKADRRADALDADERQLDAEERRLRQERESFAEEVRRERASLAEEVRTLRVAEADFHRRAVSYDEHVRENQILKADLRNTAVGVARQNFEQHRVREEQARIESLANQVAHRYLAETQTWVSRSLTETNYVSNKRRLQDAIARCRAMGAVVTAAQEAEYLAALQREYEAAVRAANERDRLSRARDELRVEQQRLRDAEIANAQREQAEAETRAFQEAVDRALRDATGKQTAEVVLLQQQLAESQAKLLQKTEKAISLAQQTKVGNVYVISNIGSFGEGVFKIGLTRRRDPQERVDELGDASVPFPFDVHMMIKSDNAPELEHRLHKHFVRHQVNKVNPRKEFFRVSLEEIVAAVEELHGEAVFCRPTAEAKQYYDSLTIQPEEQDFIERVNDAVEAETPGGLLED